MSPENQDVRVRVAPSPTGDPHVGTAYIALFNYAFAKKYGGKFILRIEDTDQSRSNKESEEMIFAALKWLGINYDEGPDVGGEYGPYRQSERLNIYQEHAQKMVDDGEAYYCFCTSERLDELREKQKANKEATGYDRHCRELSDEEIKKHLEQKTPYVIRQKFPLSGSTEFHDEMRGEISFENSTMQDQIILKTDGFPTYHLASVVDDHLMKITHVIRAEEWISSTPRHVHLYRALGFEQPKWIHMPLLRNKNKSKISKRKNPVSINYYKQAGYLPEAICNFLALMGFSIDDETEIFTLEEMIKHLELSKIKLGGPVFDMDKLNWLNGIYLRNLPQEDLVKKIEQNVFNHEYLRQIVPLIQERIEKLEDFIAANAFFFVGNLDYEGLPILPKNKEKKEFVKVLNGLAEKLDAINTWDLETVTESINSYRNEIEWKPKDLFMPLRFITTGKKDSPPLFDTIAVLGKERTRGRIRHAINFLKQMK